MATRPPDEREFSFGGLVVRAAAEGPEVVVIVPAGKPVLALPKGGPSPGESGAQTALREVREEAGVVARVREPLGEVRYWYRRGGKRVFKVVSFFLCDYVSGDTADHDLEVDEARWVPLEEAGRALSYPGEREIAQRALSRLIDGR